MSDAITNLPAANELRKLTAEAIQLAICFSWLATSCDSLISKYSVELTLEHPEMITKLESIKREMQDDAWLLRSSMLSPMLEPSLRRIVDAKRIKQAQTRLFLDSLRDRARARQKPSKSRAERASNREDE